MNQSNKYIPNYAPIFYEKPWNFTIKGGDGKITIRLPDYYDPNPNDTVTLSVLSTNQKMHIFSIQNNKDLVIDTGSEFIDNY